MASSGTEKLREDAVETPVHMRSNASNGDDALQLLQETNETPAEIDEMRRKQLLRKIDRNLMPVMCLVYGLNYLDKTTLSYASVMGLKSQIGLEGDQYQWLGSIFYFGYLVFEYPTSCLLQRLPLGKYSAFNVFMWGATLTCFAAVNSFAGAATVRLFLGVFEAAVTPGFALLTSQWYTKDEQGFRTAIWFCFNGFAQVVGGLIAYGIAVSIRKYGSALESWQVIFLVTGLLTAAMGIVFYFVIPDSQLNARWLTKEERNLAVERIRVNQQGIGNKHWKVYQFKEALLDPMTWLFFFYSLFSNIPNGGITNFFSQLIVSFGYTQEQSLLYGTPGGAVEVTALLLWGWLTSRYGHRIITSSFFLFVAIAGMILIVSLPLQNREGRLAGYYLTQANPAPFVAILSLISTNVAGYTKKTTVAALYLVGYCTGNIIGPQLFRPRDEPRYVPAEIAIIVCWVICLLTLVATYSLCRVRNSKKQLRRRESTYRRLVNQEFLDLTDVKIAILLFLTIANVNPEARKPRLQIHLIATARNLLYRVRLSRRVAAEQTHRCAKPHESQSQCIRPGISRLKLY